MGFHTGTTRNKSRFSVRLLVRQNISKAEASNLESRVVFREQQQHRHLNISEGWLG